MSATVLHDLITVRTTVRSKTKMYNGAFASALNGTRAFPALMQRRCRADADDSYCGRGRYALESRSALLWGGAAASRLGSRQRHRRPENPRSRPNRDSPRPRIKAYSTKSCPASRMWSLIAEANGVTDPKALQVGALLWIPDRYVPQQPPSTVTALDATRSRTIQSDSGTP